MGSCWTITARTLNIEALTMVDMAKKQILPAVLSYMKDISATASQKKALGAGIPCELEETLLQKLSNLSACFYKKTDALEKALWAPKTAAISLQQEADYYKATVFTAMQELRAAPTSWRTLLGKEYWPFPSYSDLLFRV